MCQIIDQSKPFNFIFKSFGYFRTFAFGLFLGNLSRPKQQCVGATKELTPKRYNCNNIKNKTKVISISFRLGNCINQEKNGQHIIRGRIYNSSA